MLLRVLKGLDPDILDYLVSMISENAAMDAEEMVCVEAFAVESKYTWLIANLCINAGGDSWTIFAEFWVCGRV